MATSRQAPIVGRAPDRRSLSEVVADEIQEHILTNGLPPGTKLPTEPELMEQFGVSRTVVREAVRAIVQRGLVEVRPRRGMTVATSSFDVLTNQLTILLRTTPAGTDQLVEIRELVEPAVARLAAERRTEDNIRALEDALGRGETEGADVTFYLESDIAFHEALAKATGNPFFQLFTTPTSALLRQTYAASFDYLRYRRFTQHEHREIFRAVAAGEAPRAEEAARRHLERVRRSVKELVAGTTVGPNGESSAPRQSKKETRGPAKATGGRTSKPRSS